jgi:hypothetical protein
MWAGLPHELQSRLFDEVVSENEDMKPDLALLLHEQHPRTRAGSKQSRAIIEPDSLGG